MIQATGSQIIIKLLELEGITTVAGIPGGSILPLYDELNRSSIRHVLVRHEQAAGFIAQGMTRSSGKPAVCMATSGPGAMNLLTAIADARCDSVPIIAITGQVNTSLIGTDAFQEADTFGLSFPITKHSMMVKSARELLTAIPLAFSIAVSGRPGPVLIDVPRDVQLEKIEFESWPEISTSAQNKHSALAQRFCTPKDQIPSLAKNIVDLLLTSKKPVLFLGGGCNSEETFGYFKSFLSKYDAAVVTSLMGIGSVSHSDSHNFGMVGMHGAYAANLAMHDADVVFACGVRFDDRATGAVAKFCPNAKIIHIDVDAAEINKILGSCISIVCDIESALPVVNELMDETVAQIKKNSSKSEEYAEYCEARKAWISYLRGIYNETESVETGRSPDVAEGSENPRAFIRDIPEFAKKAGLSESDIIVTTDVGQHQMWSAQYYPVEHARQFLTSGSLGTMGFGLPAALGAALQNPEKRIVCISGDGSILMNVQEMATLSELGLNVTVIVLQNGALGMVHQQQEYLFNKNYSASEFIKVPDFVQMAQGFGIEAHDANTDKEWYMKAFTKGPHFVRLNISMKENVLPFVKAGSANIDALRN